MVLIAQFIIRLDHAVFHAINSIAGKNPLLDWLARVGADDHIIPVVLTLLVLFVVFLAVDGRSREAAWRCLICALLASLLSMLILYGLNQFFFRPRPFSSQTVNFLFYHNTDSAFPSNAATLAFVLAFSVLFYRRKLGYLMLALAAFVGLSRVMVGVHYPLDIVGGMLLGFSSAAVARVLEPLYRPLAGLLTDAEYRLLGSWSRQGARVHPGGVR